MTDTNTVQARLVTIMERVAGPDLDRAVDPTGEDSIRRLGLTSVRLLEFMVAVEDDLDVLWGDDADTSVTASFHAMAHYLTGRTTPPPTTETGPAATTPGGDRT